MENLIFCLNATMPIFLTMVLGMVFKRMGLFDEAFIEKANQFVFVVALPCLLFRDLSAIDIRDAWDTRFVLFCLLATAASIALAGLLSLGVSPAIRGEFVQATYRSSAAILGLSLIQNLYGTSGMAPLMIVSSVPLYNAMAVVVLMVFKPQPEPLTRQLAAKTLSGIAKNPIILGILAGILWSLLRLPVPTILHATVSNVGVLATPIGLMVMGAAFDPKAVFQKLGPVLCASAAKLLLFAALFLPLAIRMGFTDEKLVAILVMLCSSTTVSCYIMARNMGHEGTLTSGAIMLTTFLSAFTLTGWLYLLRTLGCI